MKPSEIRHAIERKTEYQIRRRKEINYVIFRQGQRISRVTVPHGRKDLKTGTERSIRNQLLLDKEQFKDFVNCLLSGEDYAAILDGLIERGEL
ncbi:type II toxin-antitoxin system HicA family toxin [Candidatus Poribacteria bacterium]|nr:type II toxin-antitoxin system HicA family toxin [Candidatus Poribacteria bacterium]